MEISTGKEMAVILYYAHSIRGSAGESASKAKIAHNIEIACEKAGVLRAKFPDIKWIVPHEDDIINKLHELGLVQSQHIIDAELALIRDKYDGVVSVGRIHPETGVAQEVICAHEADKFLCILDDVDEQSLEWLAHSLAEWNE